MKKFILFLLLLFTFTACGKANQQSLETDKEKIVERKTEIESSNKNTTESQTEIENIQKPVKGQAYFKKDDVALYLHLYKELPVNYLTKSEAKEKGWVASKGNLWEVTDKGVIGGDKFSNREGKLPKDEKYFEADVNYQGGRRRSERLVYTKDGKVIYYTKDHYESFEVLYE